jgi:aspartate/methionine/tyrosine aminotransferase
MINEDSITECIRFAEKTGRKIAGLIITNPDNPTGLTVETNRQVQLAKHAIRSGVAFVLFDWMYHYVTDEQPMDLNTFLPQFTDDERKKILFLDGITKSLGASNIRNCHLIAPDEVSKFIVSRASHSVIPSYFSMAVAMAAYEMEYSRAVEPIVKPTNASRIILKDLLEKAGMTHIIGKGYYAFINVGKWLRNKNWQSSEILGSYLAEENGMAIVPGAFFSDAGKDWIRFSYATPPEKTRGAFLRMIEALACLEAA